MDSRCIFAAYGVIFKHLERWIKQLGGHFNFFKQGWPPLRGAPTALSPGVENTAVPTIPGRYVFAGTENPKLNQDRRMSWDIISSIK
jgi:hypothetical protein